MPSFDPHLEAQIFAEAIEAANTVDREAILSRRCGDNLELRQRIEALLMADARGATFDAACEPFTQPLSFSVDLSGQETGRYKLMERIGEGGMGDVYLARDLDTNEKCAVKIIKPGMDSRQVVSRFEFEQATLRALSHPHIARFINAGMSSVGRPYIAMELIAGIPITNYCDRYQLTIEERLDLFTDLCSAIEYAHQAGILHRDLKPANILVLRQQDRPIVKVIDFGVAKA